MKNTLDIDSLHADIEFVLTNAFKQRISEDYTQAYLYLMLDETWGGDNGNNYLYVGPNSYHTKRLFRKLVESYGIAATDIGCCVDLPVYKQRFIFVDSEYCAIDESLTIQHAVNRVFMNCGVNKGVANLIGELLSSDGDII
jgi:hypothetical protein